MNWRCYRSGLLVGEKRQGPGGASGQACRAMCCWRATYKRRTAEDTVCQDLGALEKMHQNTRTRRAQVRNWLSFVGLHFWNSRGAGDSRQQSREGEPWGAACSVFCSSISASPFQEHHVKPTKKPPNRNGAEPSSSWATAAKPRHSEMLVKAKWVPLWECKELEVSALLFFLNS